MVLYILRETPKSSIEKKCFWQKRQLQTWRLEAQSANGIQFGLTFTACCVTAVNSQERSAFVKKVPLN